MALREVVAWLARWTNSDRRAVDPESLREAPSPTSRRQDPDDTPATDDGKHMRWYVPSGPDQKYRFQLVDGVPPIRLIPYRDQSGEELLRLCEDKTGLLIAPKNRYLSSIGIYSSQLRGEKYNESGSSSGDFSPGAPVRLVREPGNPHDRNAIAVYDITGAHRAAYVDRLRARLIAPILDAGGALDAIAIRGTAAGRACRQIGIVAATPPVLRHLMTPRPPGAPMPAHLRWP
ncbi:HIRAN domain-containing protein [Pseudonocardia sp. T1-2H]|uniref:HIRAN domain-containing protein n=1 Tax=Pseudonocardia sp. T1-2H TaxID=3128899 RepID=UPI0040544E78